MFRIDLHESEDRSVRRTIEEGETVCAKILDVYPHRSRPGFAVRYGYEAGERVAFLPSARNLSTVVVGRELIKVGRLLRLTVFEDGAWIGEARELVPGRRVAMA